MSTPDNERLIRRRARILTWSLIAIILLALAPIVSVLLASAIASANGCEINEGTVNACNVFGTDAGATLYAMFVAGWYIFLTFPVSALLLAIWAVATALWRVPRADEES